MKKLFLTFLGFFALMSCTDSHKACLCVKQKYERKVVKSTATQAVISASEWQAAGSAEPYSTDCDLHGSVASSGSTGAMLLPSGNYSVTEYEYRVSCK